MVLESEMENETIVIETPAKINLGLRVVGRRSDGFHLIETVFQTVGLYDRLEFNFSGITADRYRVRGDTELDFGQNNLICRALKKLRAEGVSIPPVDIQLHKNIPIGGGLGGGSSDAAAIFHLAEILGEKTILQETKYSEIAAELGADVPFFLQGGTALGEGIGEILTPLPDQRAFVLLAVPDYSINTEWAYNNLENNLDNTENMDSSKDPEDRSDLWKKWDLHNAFEPLVCEKHPVHNGLLGSYSEFTDYYSTTGSGSAVYGLFKDRSRARQAEEKLGNKWPDVDWFFTSFINSENCPKIKKEGAG